MTLAFLCLLFILKRFAWKPILEMLKAREHTIDEAIHAADIARQEIEKLKLNNEQLLKEAKAERDLILKEARQIRDSIIDEAKMKSNEEANRIIQAAKESINYEKMAALTDLKNQIATLSIEIAEKLISEEISKTEKQEKIIKQMLDKMSFN
ncbi:MAG TPA: F0F1 ATP synthase subunit B [Bacteroidales bacterium]|nr:F0F1 ATP synthase subunit B [Bacteroidales bacterium]